MSSSKRLRVVLVLLALLSFFTLSGCSGEDDIEELENWREDFFDVPSREELSVWIKIPIGILSLLILGLFISTANNLQDEGYATISIPILLSIGVLLLILFPETAVNIAQRALPPEVNLEWMLNKLRVVEDGGLADKVYKSWVTSTISTVPTRFTLSIGILLIANFFAMFVSILGKSQRGLIFFIASLIGVAAFMSLWVVFIYYMDRVWPGGDSIVRKASMNIAFVVFTNFLFLLCFYALPVSAFILYPKSWDLKNRIKEEKEKQNTALIQTQEKSWDLPSLAGFIGTILGYMSGRINPETVEETANTTYGYGYDNTRHLPQLCDPEDDVIDGEYTIIIPPKRCPDDQSDNYSRRSNNSINPLHSENPNNNYSYEDGEFIPSPNENYGREKLQHSETVVESTKKSRLFTPTKMAALADGIAIGATATGHPGVGTAAKIAGSALSAYSFAKEQKEQKENSGDPIITFSAGADLVSNLAKAINKPELAKISDIMGNVASTTAAVRESKRGD